jgi:hypothetical protein
VPTDRDIYPSTCYAKNALVQAEPRALFRDLLDQGWVDAIRKPTCGTAGRAMQAFASILCC